MSQDFQLVPLESSCQANPDRGVVNCSIGVLNIGHRPARAYVLVDYRYSDGAVESDTNGNGSGPNSDPIPATEMGWVYFSHPYEASAHDLVGAAVTLDAKSWSKIRAADPSDIDWPG